MNQRGGSRRVADALHDRVRALYLHGFASGPDSRKGTYLADRYARRGVSLERLDLRLPSFEHLRMSAMIDHVRARIGGPDDRAVVLGSSLGGAVAARTAVLDRRVQALVLLAPAFRLAARWQARVPADIARWRETGWAEVDDHTTGGKARVDFGFFEDAARTDPDWPDVRVPTLVVHGVRDDIVTIDASREWVAARPWARLVEVDDDHELGASLDRIGEEAERFLAPWLG